MERPGFRSRGRSQAALNAMPPSGRQRDLHVSRGLSPTIWGRHRSRLIWREEITVSERDRGPAQDPAPVRVALVDDHELFRHGLRDLLEAHGLEVVGEASSGEEAIGLAAEQIPDVVLMDLSMPGISGVEATRQIRVDTPHTRLVMLTVSADEEDVNEAILAGASGYLLKDGP